MEIEETVAGTFLEGAEIVRVSALKGTGIEALKEKIYELAKVTQSKSHRGQTGRLNAFLHGRGLARSERRSRL